MSADIARLPDSGVRAWRVFDKTLADGMRAFGANETLSAYVREQLKPVYLNLQLQHRVRKGASGDEAVQSINDWASKNINGLLMALAVRELELYQLRGPRK